MRCDITKLSLMRHGLFTKKTIFTHTIFYILSNSVWVLKSPPLVWISSKRDFRAPKSDTGCCRGYKNTVLSTNALCKTSESEALRTNS